MAPIRFCELKNRFVKSGGQGKQVTLTEYNVNILNSVDKGDLPLIQLFDTDYRVSTQNVDWNLWNGCVYIDIDSKHYYNEVRQFDIDRLFDLLYEYLLVAYTFNFYCIQKSASGTSYHFWFYFKVEKSEDNFKKAEDLARNMVVEAFENVGAGEIIHYKVGDKAVLDSCTVSPFQGFHPSCYPFSFGNHSLLWFGEFDGWNQYEFERPVRVSDIKEDGTKMFELMEFKPIDKKIKLEHRSRLAVYMALKAVYGSFKETQVAWEYLCRNCIADGDKHKSIDYIKEGERWSRYNYPVNVNILKKFGYTFSKAFEPRKIDFYKPDVVYELGEDQYMSNIQIKWSYEKINHLYAGCSLGKTHNAKSLGVKEIIDDIDWVFGKRNKRVCFISPMRSINKDGFEKEKRDEWIIVDSDHDTTNKEIYDSIHHVLRNSELNVCVTWESYCAYQMYQIPFDYVIVDEVHTFFMYDYRVASITEMKRALERATGIRILMTGTPSAELKEFDCYKIQVKKKMTKVPAEIVLYKNQFKGYWLSDIREWTKDPSHCAILFYDRTNYKTEEMFERAGMKCSVFNTNYTENVDYILNNNNVFSQITAFSVYGQAGINLYIDTDKKVRIYILNKNGLGIIQYANRVRNREVIDKVIIGYPTNEVDNDVIPLSHYVDYETVEKKTALLNENKVSFDVIDIRQKQIIELTYGLPTDCLEKLGDVVSLNRDRYKTYRMIKNVSAYERQLQVIYNRLTSNDFDVVITKLDKDTKDISTTKLQGQNFAGQMTRFNFDIFKKQRDGGFWLDLDDDKQLKKVCIGDTAKQIEDIFNSLYVRNEGDFEKTKSDFRAFVNSVIKRNNTIRKKDISDYALMLEITRNWESYYDNAFIVVLMQEDVTVAQTAALYVRTIYKEGMNWRSIADEAYVRIFKLKKVVDTYRDIFDSLGKPYDFKVINDEKTKEIYTYLVNKHTRGSNKKSVTLDGITYADIDDAVKKTGLSKRTIYRRLKAQG